SSRRAALLGLVLIVIGRVLLDGRLPVQSQAANGIVQVAFTATLNTGPNLAPIATAYQRVALNILQVRLNPRADLTIADTDPNWVTIPAPAQVGVVPPSEFITTSQNYGGGSQLSAATSIMQLDLMPLQNIAFFFSGATIPAGTYGQI